MMVTNKENDELVDLAYRFAKKEGVPFNGLHRAFASVAFEFFAEGGNGDKIVRILSRERELTVKEMKRKARRQGRATSDRLDLARSDFMNACVVELNKHAVKFRTIYAVGVACGDVIAYAEKRYRLTGVMPTPWKVMCSFERKFRRTLRGRRMARRGGKP